MHILIYEKVIDVCEDKYFYQSLRRYKHLAFIIWNSSESNLQLCLENIVINNKCILASLITLTKIILGYTKNIQVKTVIYIYINLPVKSTLEDISSYTFDYTDLNMHMLIIQSLPQ